MKTKIAFFSLLVSLLGIGYLVANAQDDEVRGAFMTTRPKPSPGKKPTSNQKPNRRRPKVVTPEPGKGTTPSSPSTTSSTKIKPQRLGIGLTLFMRDSNGLSVRANPSREFKKGERVRVLLETNTDGYLYIFNTTDDGAPMMIYPDPELDEAGNFIQAHVPIEIPSSLATEERLRWFAFDQYPGTEKLYFVFTREPLEGVPMEDDLISFCRDNQSKCPWAPAQDVWARIKSEAKETGQNFGGSELGTAQSASEQQAATRGIGLNRDDPEPSLIMLSATTEQKILVATMSLVHKAIGIVVE